MSASASGAAEPEAERRDEVSSLAEPSRRIIDGAEAWETVIGLEVHAELSTRTKLFSSAPNEFGGEPNTHIDPVTLGLPGSLPVLNEAAVTKAMRAGLALNCEVRPSVFSRKNYFYPDMPKDYQISQYDLPINVDGWLELPSGTRIGIERAHLEEDTGKSTHVGESGRIHGAGYSLEDYNRAGVPLLEIVSRPDLRSAEDARQYVSELRAILVAVDASDGKMEEGSLRVDANVSVRPVGSETLGTRCEIKNVNSLRSLGRAIDYEVARQIDLITAGERVVLETRHWDEAAGRTQSGRSKEEAQDYRYFPEPDLVPLDPDQAWIDEVRASLPVLPAERRHRLAEVAGVLPGAVAIHVERDRDGLCHDAITAGADPTLVLKHVEHDIAPEGDLAFGAPALAALVAMETSGQLTATQAKQVLAEMAESGRAPVEIAAERGFEAMGSGELEGILDGIVADHPDDWAAFVAADDAKAKKLTGFFIGKLMQATRGQADGKVATDLLFRRRRAG
jgi:aspartyl-tRNA(Asn)/glutamyl-tRNA(Gln) amidotransferase subunit B